MLFYLLVLNFRPGKAASGTGHYSVPGAGLAVRLLHKAVWVQLLGVVSEPHSCSLWFLIVFYLNMRTLICWPGDGGEAGGVGGQAWPEHAGDTDGLFSNSYPLFQGPSRPMQRLLGNLQWHLGVSGSSPLSGEWAAGRGPRGLENHN